VRALVVEDLKEFVEAGLLLQKIATRPGRSTGTQTPEPHCQAREAAEELGA